MDHNLTLRKTLSEYWHHYKSLIYNLHSRYDRYNPIKIDGSFYLDRIQRDFTRVAILLQVVY